MQAIAPCWQQAPEGGQGLGLQLVELAPIQPNGHALPAKDWQMPVVWLQQTAMGGLQLLTEAHVVPVPCQTPGGEEESAAQAAALTTMVQMFCPAVLRVQHAPQVGTQTSGGRQLAPGV